MKKLAGGLLVILEGGDGVGKTIHAKALADYYNAQGYSAKYFREPGGDKLAEDIRNIILYNEMDSITETLLMNAARRININNNILPALRNGEIVILDRFTKSTIVYQGVLNKGNMRFIDTCINEVIKDLYDDTYGYSIEFTLLCDAEVAIERAANDGHERNKYDTMPIEKYKMTNNAYHDLWRETNGAIPCLIDTTILTKEEVFKELVKSIDRIIKSCDIIQELK